MSGLYYSTQLPNEVQTPPSYVPSTSIVCAVTHAATHAISYVQMQLHPDWLWLPGYERRVEGAFTVPYNPYLD